MDDPKIVVIANRKNRRLIRLLNAWNNPGPNNKKHPPGTIEKVGSNTFLFSGTEYAVRCVHFILGRYGKDLRVFMIAREMTFKDDFLAGIGSSLEALRLS